MKFTGVLAFTKIKNPSEMKHFHDYSEFMAYRSLIDRSYVNKLHHYKTATSYEPLICTPR